MTTTKPRVLIVEDETAIAQLLLLNLRHSGFEPVLALNAKSAQAHIDEALPDVVLLDWMLPDGAGPELAKRWRNQAHSKTVPIIMITARGAEPDKITGLEAGADDYITKPFSPQELIARIRALLRRRLPEKSSPQLQLGDLMLDAASHRVTYQGQAIKLGPTEFKLLLYFMTYPDRVHSRSQLLDKVWGSAAMIEERTVDVHVKRLREGLQEAGKYLETVRGAGYQFTAYSSA